MWSTFHIMEFSKRHHKERIYSIYAFQGDRGVHPGARRGERRKRSNRHFWPTDRPTDRPRQAAAAGLCGGLSKEGPCLSFLLSCGWEANQDDDRYRGRKTAAAAGPEVVVMSGAVQQVFRDEYRRCSRREGVAGVEGRATTTTLTLTTTTTTMLGRKEKKKNLSIAKRR